MVIGDILLRFMKKSPVAVMARAVMEFVFPDEALDRLFQRSAKRQYQDKLLFSTVVRVLAVVVMRGRKSVRNAYLAERQEADATMQALYDKLQNTEPAVVSAMVRESFGRLRPLVGELKAQRKPLFPGYCTKILDGAHLTGTQHRIQETRNLHSSPLPGQALVVLQPDERLISDMFPCEDAYAQERSLLDAVLDTIEKHDLVIADRNFCTTNFIFSLVLSGGAFIIRQHASTLHGKELLGKRKRIGRGDGGVVYEQILRITNPFTQKQLFLRRLTIVLDKPTTDGDTEIHILSNLPKQFTGLRIAAAYRQRWRIENAFQEIEQALRGEVNTLGYPKAALLAFSIALLMYNVLAVVKGALQSKHGEAAAFEKLSGYCLASEIAAVHAGMMVAIPPAEWTATFRDGTVQQVAAFLRDAAGHANPARFYRSPRGPKKPPPHRTGGLREKHVSTHRLLLARSKIRQQ